MRHAMRGTRIAFATCLIAFGLAGCGGRNTTDGGIIPNVATILKVENDSFSDMRIYVVQSGQRVRIGTAGGKSVSSFTLPQAIMHGIRTLAFEAVPIGANGKAISEEITVNPGEQVTLRIPPTAGQ